MSSLFHSQSITISEASIYFYSHQYKNLICKIIENQTCIVISSQLINNCLQTNFSINRDLEDFRVELFHHYESVGQFSFTYDDLEKAIERQENRRSSFECPYLSKRKYIKFKKENDSCSLYFTVQSKDFLRKNEFDVNEGFLYQQFLRNLSQKVYKRLERKALHRIKKTQQSILCEKRKSMIELRQSEDRNGSKSGVLTISLKQDEEKRILLENQYEENIHFSKSCINSLGLPIKNQNKVQSNTKNSYLRLKNEYKMRKLRQKAKNMFSPTVGTDLILQSQQFFPPSFQFHKNGGYPFDQNKMPLISGGVRKIPLNFENITRFSNENIIRDDGWISSIKISKEGSKWRDCSLAKTSTNLISANLSKSLRPIMAFSVPNKFESEYKPKENRGNGQTERKKIKKKRASSGVKKNEHHVKVLFENAVKFK